VEIRTDIADSSGGIFRYISIFDDDGTLVTSKKLNVGYYGNDFKHY
jgi:hypothetical protein